MIRLPGIERHGVPTQPVESRLKVVLSAWSVQLISSIALLHLEHMGTAFSCQYHSSGLRGKFSSYLESNFSTELSFDVGQARVTFIG